jgi:hypothetical protein
MPSALGNASTSDLKPSMSSRFKSLLLFIFFCCVVTGIYAFVALYVFDDPVLGDAGYTYGNGFNVSFPDFSSDGKSTTP